MRPLLLLCRFIAAGLGWCLSAASSASAGPFAPPAGQPGSTAVAHNDPRILFWASGHENYDPGSNVILEFMTPGEALGPAATGADPDVEVLEIVSLGDGGEITLTFPRPIVNGPGDDFAVFENAFSNTFLELAYVEASSDGIHFVRFPSASLTPGPVDFLGASVDATNVDGLAGKYRLGFGTPFDLDDIGLTNASHLRFVDVPGDGTALDTDNRPIYDPHPSEVAGGFDLDAVAVLGLTFAGWKAVHFNAAEQGNASISGPGADPDFDGLPNNAEYAIDSDPKQFNSLDWVVSADPVAGYFQFFFHRSAIAKDAVVHVDVSSGLASWDEIARAANGSCLSAFGNPGASSIVESVSGTLLMGTVADFVPLSATTARFARLRITSP